MKLGDVAVDRISGFKGVATCRLEYLNGCVRWQVSPQELHDGKPVESHYFDNEQLEVVPDYTGVALVTRAGGGDRPTPAARGSAR
jgi:hypothetical protein